MSWTELDIKVQAALISAITSLAIFGFGWLFRVINEAYSLNYKLKKEYLFEQKKLIKVEMAKTKVPLLNSAEELNYRMWNFNQNISEGYHRIDRDNWFHTNQYYLNSFIYRFLVFMSYCIKTEEGILSMDSTVADKDDIVFLKYVKTFKNLFCEFNLLTDLGYKQNDDANHFFRNELKGYCSWVEMNGKVVDFEDFNSKLRYSYDDLEKVIEYFSKIENNDSDKTLNILRCAHLLAVSFLNRFGHSYQYTEKDKMNTLNNYYKDHLMIKSGFKEFITASKLDKEFKSDFKAVL
ncbi:hypothetical protein [Halomonas citrativorans]|uniref:hypothetical protein n=1 Tax=Halomonas citrativorans TaxID=2742612 RepID=UPI000B34F2BF|nr:hypothetical protein [Halomonas citrativorans]